MKLSIGHRITRADDPLAQVLEIVDVRPTGYGWRYVPPAAREGLAESYSSEATQDRFFDRGWSLVEPQVPVASFAFHVLQPLPTEEEHLPG